MIAELGTITLYVVLHDWLPLGAALVAGYKVWEHLKNFKSDIQKDIKSAKADMLTSTQSLEKTVTEGQKALEKAVNFQTASLVDAFGEMREDFRAYWRLTTPVTGMRAVRAKKKAKLDISAQA